MKLRTVVVLASTLTILVFSIMSEMLSYQRVAEVFTRFETHIHNGGSADALVAAAKVEKLSLLWNLAALRLLSTAVALATLAVVLNLLWVRLVNRPISLLLNRIDSMSRGTWTQPLTVERHDEIGGLVKEFNLLGRRLTFVAHQYAAASKLAAMALIGQRVNRRATAARWRVEELQKLLIEARLANQVVPQGAVRRIGKVAEELMDLAADLESEFNDELVRQGLSASELRSDENGPVLEDRYYPNRTDRQPKPARVTASNVKACSRNPIAPAVASAVRTSPFGRSESCG